MEKDKIDLDVSIERERQDAKWGKQSHPNGTGEDFEEWANLARELCDRVAEKGKLTWRDILTEEVYEAFAESDRDKLRTELVQVMSVAKAWIECLDNNAN